MRKRSCVAPDWWDYTTLDPQSINDAAALTVEDIFQLSRPGFQVKFFVQIPAGKQAAEVAVAGVIFDQAYGTPAVGRIGHLGTHDGGDALPPACRQKGPQSVKVVGVGKGYAIIANQPCRTTDLLDGIGAPHQRIVGSNG